VASTELSTGMIDYDDTGGDGPMVVPVRGLTQSGTVWREVVADLRADHRIVVPTLPLGRTDNRCATMPTSPRGLAPLIAKFLERLDLHGSTCTTSPSSPTTGAARRSPRLSDPSGSAAGARRHRGIRRSGEGRPGAGSRGCDGGAGGSRGLGPGDPEDLPRSVAAGSVAVGEGVEGAVGRGLGAEGEAGGGRCSALRRQV
jgi:hypothetical protein